MKLNDLLNGLWKNTLLRRISVKVLPGGSQDKEVEVETVEEIHRAVEAQTVLKDQVVVGPEATKTETKRVVLLAVVALEEMVQKEMDRIILEALEPQAIEVNQSRPNLIPA